MQTFAHQDGDAPAFETTFHQFKSEAISRFVMHIQAGSGRNEKFEAPYKVFPRLDGNITVKREALYALATADRKNALTGFVFNRFEVDSETRLYKTQGCTAKILDTPIKNGLQNGEKIYEAAPKIDDIAKQMDALPIIEATAPQVEAAPAAHPSRKITWNAFWAAILAAIIAFFTAAGNQSAGRFRARGA